MAKSHYSFKKRKKEIERKQKQEQKRQRRLEKGKRNPDGQPNESHDEIVNLQQ